MNKIALITGSSRGIGKEIAKSLASKSYDIVINYNNSKEEALNLKEYITNTFNVKAICIKADVSSEEEVKSMIEETYNTFGAIDVVVNNAGIAIDTTFEDKTVDNFRRILDVNLIGTFLVSKYASKYMKNGTIINISSNNGIDAGYPEGMDYDASKAGVISLTRNLAKELSPNIRVNAIATGWVNTAMNKELDSDYKKEEENKILLKRFAEPSEIASVVVFLASEEASYINGTVIRVDGGY